ncbi:hypothetical protein B0H65DRAFT_590815 [Neurospora tetraspora]|uniref:Uncharacterized protein n=1 Tax=Neurospora tetraspora TaxID=94610 RepID=A0AAE0MPM1_9PEZI|nr:hypothetical protein B0H65DRAFT_590815 [Neurospora tetraspora]
MRCGLLVLSIVHICEIALPDDNFEKWNYLETGYPASKKNHIKESEGFTDTHKTVDPFFFVVLQHIACEDPTSELEHAVPLELWEGPRELEEYAREVFPLEEQANGLTWMIEEDDGGGGNNIDNDQNNRRQKEEHCHQNGHQNGHNRINGHVEHIV